MPAMKSSDGYNGQINPSFVHEDDDEAAPEPVSQIPPSTRAKLEIDVKLNDDDNAKTNNKNKNDKSSSSNSTNPIFRIIQNHFTTTGSPKSEAQLAREKWLIPNLIPFNRWFLFPAAVLTQFCCGSLYAWSVYNKPIDILIYGEVTNMAPITYCIAVGVYGLSAGLMGPWLERRGPKIGAALAATLLCTGNLLTALALHFRQLWLVFLAYGLIAGFGIGVGNICPVSPLQQWFPDKRGLASGFAVCGFGIGATAAAKIQILLIDSVGLSLTFVILGCSYFVIMCCCAMVLRTPPTSPEEEEAKKQRAQAELQQTENGNTGGNSPKGGEYISYTLVEALTSSTYRLMYLMFFAKALTGSVIISRLSNIITDVFEKTPEEAATVVSISVAFILFGDLSMPLLSDVIGRKYCFIFMLSADLAVLSCFTTITTTQTYWAILLGIFVVINCHGGGFSVTPAYLTDAFGSINTGTCYGILLTASSIAGVGGGLLFTAIFDSSEEGRESKDPWPYNVNTYWMIGIVIIGWIGALVIPLTRTDLRFVRRLKRLFCCCKRQGEADIEK